MTPTYTYETLTHTLITQAHVVELTSGNVSKRKELWEQHRIFFCTAQILDNDLKSGNKPSRCACACACVHVCMCAREGVCVYMSHICVFVCV